MDKKFKVFAFCLPLTLSFLVIPLSWGEIDTEKAIIGKWEQYDPKGNETLEFFKDGTVSTFHESFGFSVAGDYRFIDNKHVRINLGGLWALVGPIVCKVSVSGNNLILTMPDGEVEKYWRVGIKPGQIESTADKDEAVRIQEEIERRLRILNTTTYTYLLDIDSIRSAISTTWMHLTSPIRGNLVEKYNEFYYAAWDYQGMALSALRKARSSLK
ncbi:MAG: hypothetical protein QMC83_09950 [Thermodesulfovibrionales bacterium]|nr:hypothetical protein [Thermodesulfovibrionales bacterium]